MSVYCDQIGHNSHIHDLSSVGQMTSWTLDNFVWMVVEEWDEDKVTQVGDRRGLLSLLNRIP